MAEAHCAVCAASGFHSCDECGGPVFDWQLGIVPGRDLCGYCVPPEFAQALREAHPEYEFWNDWETRRFAGAGRSRGSNR